MRRFSLGAVVAATALIALPSSAGAATQIGETFNPDVSCGGGQTRVQSESPGGQYAAPTAGVITRWSFEANASPPQIRLRVGRAAPDANFAGDVEFTMIGQSALEAPDANTLNSFFTQVPVQAGDVIGNFTSTTGNCMRTNATYTEHVRGEDVVPPATANFHRGGNLQLDISALLEPDCDQDGLGDETQDNDIASCGPAAVAAQTKLGCKDLQPTIVGTEGPDVLVGTAGSDVLSALGGNDKAVGLAGKDIICGGPGKDTLKGGKGKDTLLGQAGKDRLKGGGAKDVCMGGKGNDSGTCEVEKSL